MKKHIVLSVLFLLLIVASSKAHQSDFTEHCDAICLPFLGSSHRWHDVTSTDSALFLVGNSGVCFKYSFIGGVKTFQTGTSENLTGIQFLDNYVGFVWGTGGVLLKTVNGGENWSVVVTNTSDTINKAQFIDENNGYFRVDGFIYKTINGGITWTPLTLPPSISFNDFHFFDSQNGQICGGKLTPSLTGFLFTTTDGGNSWNQLYTDTCAFTKLFYNSNSVGYLYGSTNTNPLLLETNNAGSNWSIKYSGTSWTLGSKVVKFNNKATFISNETTGSYVYGTPYFLDPTAGLVLNPINIYSTHLNNQETLYLITNAGLFRYFSGESLCLQLNFASGISPNNTNPYNALLPGKKVRFKALFKNVTDDTILSSKSILRCVSPHIKITDSVADYKNIYNHQSAWSIDEYEIELSKNIPNSYVIHLEFLFENQHPVGTIQRSIVDLPIINNPFQISSLTVIDTATQNTLGNSNGIVEPNETAQIIPFVKNETVHYFYDVRANLFSKFPQCAIWTNTTLPDGYGVVYNNYPYGNINPNQISQPTGVFVFTDSFKVNYNIPFTLVLTGQITTFTDENNYIYKNYSNILYNYGIEFFINTNFSSPSDSLLAQPTDTTINDIVYNSLALGDYIFPNPNNGEFVFKTRGSVYEENSKIEIFNIMGECIYKQTTQPNLECKINILEQPSGAYFLTIKGYNFNRTLRFIKL